MSDAHDLLILGTGAIGSAAFYHAAKRGLRVLALEQFEPAHDRGSSHGKTRIIRQAYFEHPSYVPLLLESYRWWHELEVAAGRTLLRPTGLLEVGLCDGPVIRGIRQSAAQHGLAIEEISDATFAQRFPQFRKDADQEAVFEKQAGYLLVEACVKAHIDAAQSSGGELRPCTRIVGIEPAADRVKVVTDVGNFLASQVIVAAGAWSSQLLSFLQSSLRVRRKHQYWFQPTNSRMLESSGCPTYFFETKGGHFYGFPGLDDGLVKVARHSGGDVVADPSSVDRSEDADDWSRVRDFIGRHMGMSIDAPAKYSVCMYTMSPDEHFIVDRHPDIPQVVFCAGLSGHGFKFAPVLGRYLVDLAGGAVDDQFDFLRWGRGALQGS